MLTATILREPVFELIAIVPVAPWKPFVRRSARSTFAKSKLFARLIAPKRIRAESYVNEPHTLGFLPNAARYWPTYVLADGISVAAGTPLKSQRCAWLSVGWATKALSTFARPIRHGGFAPVAASAFAIRAPSGKYVLT